MYCDHNNLCHLVKLAVYAKHILTTRRLIYKSSERQTRKQVRILVLLITERKGK